MKIICAFCKTPFAVRGRVAKCPVCGHRAAVSKKGGSGKFFVAAALFLLVGIFAIASMRVFTTRQKSELLTVSVSDVKHTSAGYVVRGNIRNFSDQTYSVPDLMFVLKNGFGDVLSQVVQLPPSGLIEPKSDMEFIKTISPKVDGAEKISVQFVEN